MTIRAVFTGIQRRALEVPLGVDRNALAEALVAAAWARGLTWHTTPLGTRTGVDRQGRVAVLIPADLGVGVPLRFEQSAPDRRPAFHSRGGPNDAPYVSVRPTKGEP